jgi:hypothetical protein
VEDINKKVMMSKNNSKKGSFPDLNKDGKITKADVLKGRGVGANSSTNKKIFRLETREDKLVSKGKKAVDEGREKKADRLFGRAAKVENRVIKAKKK